MAVKHDGNHESLCCGKRLSLGREILRGIQRYHPRQAGRSAAVSPDDSEQAALRQMKLNCVFTLISQHVSAAKLTHRERRFESPEKYV